MNEAEPPSSHASLFRIGKDSHGHWVVQDQQGLRGGLSSAALKPSSLQCSRTGTVRRR